MNKKTNHIINHEKEINFKYPKIVSVFFLFNNKNQVLMQLRDNKKNIACPNIWGPVGGQCNQNESPKDCLIREVFEETGYKINNNLYWFGNYTLPYNNQNNEDHVVCVFWSIYDNQQKISCYEGQKIKFLDLNKIFCYEMLHINLDWIRSINKIYKNELK